jgi:flagellar biosynthetic protein FliO
MTKIYRITVLFAILITSIPLYCQQNINNITWIYKVSNSEDDKGITLEFMLRNPLEKFPEWFSQGNNKIIVSFEKSNIDPPKINIVVNSPILREIKIVQFDSKTVRTVFYGKNKLPKGIVPTILKSNDLSYKIFFPYSVDGTANVEIKPDISETQKPFEASLTNDKIEPKITTENKVISEVNIINLSPTPSTTNQQLLESSKAENKGGGYLNLNNEGKPQIPSFSKSLFKSFISLLIVIALIILTSYILKRFFLTKSKFGSPEKTMKILSNLYIGEKKRICLVEVLGKILVLGITNSNISLLTEIEGEKVMDIVSDIQKNETNNRSFTKILKDSDSNVNTEKIESKAKNLSKILKNFISKNIMI